MKTASCEYGRYHACGLFELYDADADPYQKTHPQARYFNVGKIGEDQLQDYARRRGLPIEVVRKFLAANL